MLKCCPLHVSCFGANHLFPPLSDISRVPVPYDGGAGTLPWSQWKVMDLCSLWEAGLLAPAEQQIATQGRSWDSRSWTTEMGLSCRQVQWEVLALCETQESRPSGATHTVTGYNFFTFRGESGPSCTLMGDIKWETFNGRQWALPLSGTVVSTCTPREPGLLAPA
jgi:hypothetical protein